MYHHHLVLPPPPHIALQLLVSHIDKLQTSPSHSNIPHLHPNGVYMRGWIMYMCNSDTLLSHMELITIALIVLNNCGTEKLYLKHQ